MKRFVLQSSLFILPIVILLAHISWDSNNGDLIRLGYIYDKKDFMNPLIENLNHKIYFTCVSEVDFEKKHHFSVITIGDSFSEQAYYGYKNFVAMNHEINLLHYDRNLHDNPLQTLTGIVNGDLLDSLKIDFVVLELVERACTSWAQNIITTDTIDIKKIQAMISSWRTRPTKNKNPKALFTDKTFKILRSNIQYTQHYKPTYSSTYKVPTRESLFSHPKKQLLFFEGDLDNLVNNNNIDSVRKLNDHLNYLSFKLKEKGKTLVFLPAADKYDFYYEHIAVGQFPKPQFFDHLEAMQKHYAWINSKDILKGLGSKQKDIYFYGDTHWAPIASMRIAEAIVQTITEMTKFQDCSSITGVSSNNGAGK